MLQFYWGWEFLLHKMIIFTNDLDYTIDGINSLLCIHPANYMNLTSTNKKSSVVSSSENSIVKEKGSQRTIFTYPNEFINDMWKQNMA